MSRLLLHLGCGDEHLDGYINIDIVKTEATDKVMDATKLINLPDNTVDEIIAYHLIEHLTFVQFRQALLEWCRVLKVGGKLILECPDLTETVKLFLSSSFKERWNTFQEGPCLAVHIYGNSGDDSVYDLHKSGYDKQILEFFLLPCFDNIQFGESHKDYGIPCIHVEATKREKTSVVYIEK